MPPLPSHHRYHHITTATTTPVPPYHRPTGAIVPPVPPPHCQDHITLYRICDTTCTGCPARQGVLKDPTGSRVSFRASERENASCLGRVLVQGMYSPTATTILSPCISLEPNPSARWRMATCNVVHNCSCLLVRVGSCVAPMYQNGYGRVTTGKGEVKPTGDGAWLPNCGRRQVVERDNAGNPNRPEVRHAPGSHASPTMGSTRAV